jgi:hypothetical protein
MLAHGRCRRGRLCAQTRGAAPRVGCVRRGVPEGEGARRRVGGWARTWRSGQLSARYARGGASVRHRNSANATDAPLCRKQTSGRLTPNRRRGLRAAGRPRASAVESADGARSVRSASEWMDAGGGPCNAGGQRRRRSRARPGGARRVLACGTRTWSAPIRTPAARSSPRAPAPIDLSAAARSMRNSNRFAAKSVSVWAASSEDPP